MNILDNALYLRHGIDEYNLSGTGWKQMRLKFTRTYKIEDHHQDENKMISSIVVDAESPSSSETSSAIIKTAETEEDSKKSSDPINYINYSIYDPNEEFTSIYDLKHEESNYVTSEKNRLKKQASMNVLDYTTKKPQDYTEIAKYVEETNDKLDEILKDLIKNDKKLEAIDSKIESTFDLGERDKDSSPTNSVMTTSSSGTQLLNSLLRPEHGKSVSSIISLDANIEFSQVDLHYCCANSFVLDESLIPANWFETNSNKLKRNISLENAEWKNAIVLELNKRNLREFLNIDKISFLYENDVNMMIFKAF